ncbi:MAG: hypothetical protein EA398_02965 [Deltaproteobacteria bacterium]|nr:MAG: hypothetical protein EA398_02965 [Deltaproteobacteria bacterium]
MSRPLPAENADDVTALLDRTALLRVPVGFLVARGADTLPYLQTKLTADTRTWESAGGSRAVATDINGRVIADALWHATDDGALAVRLAGDAEPLRAHLDRYVIMEDVELEASAGEVLLLVGPFEDALTAAGLPVPDTRTLQGPADGLRAARTRWLGRDAVLLVGSAEVLDDAATALEGAGVPMARPDALEAAEILSACAREGMDLLVGETIPLEAGLWEAVSFNKGCYLGQEVIERLFSRGQPNKRLVRLTWNGPPVAPRHGLEAGGRDAGFVTRSVKLSDGRSAALAYVRRRALDGEHPIHLAEAGTPVTLHGIVGGRTPTEGDGNDFGPA